jgi:hypothetical protein
MALHTSNTPKFQSISFPLEESQSDQLNCGEKANKRTFVDIDIDVSNAKQMRSIYFMEFVSYFFSLSCSVSQIWQETLRVLFSEIQILTFNINWNTIIRAKS